MFLTVLNRGTVLTVCEQPRYRVCYWTAAQARQNGIRTMIARAKYCTMRGRRVWGYPRLATTKEISTRWTLAPSGMLEESLRRARYSDSLSASAHCPVDVRCQRPVDIYLAPTADGCLYCCCRLQLVHERYTSSIQYFVVIIS